MQLVISFIANAIQIQQMIVENTTNSATEETSN